MLTIRGASGTATISEQGAEPHSLRGADGHELLWQAGEAWRRHAPILFPIVGRVPDDTVTVDGRTYPLTQHGFARDLAWDVLDAGDSSASLRLRDSAETRARFPFGFELEVHYAMDDAGLATTYVVRNPEPSGGVDLPVSLGSHPAFAWPLEPAREETAALCDRMLQLGVVVQPTGDRQNVLKVKPPLCFSRESADFFVARLDEALGG